MFHISCYKPLSSNALTYSLGQNICSKIDKSSKTVQDKKVLYLLLFAFWMLLPKFNFWEGDWALAYVSTQIWDFPNISLLPKIPRLKLFTNSWGNLYTKFAILDITFHFTCGESDLYQNIVKFQNIMTKVVIKYAIKNKLWIRIFTFLVWILFIYFLHPFFSYVCAFKN